MRKLFVAATAALLALAIVAAPASAKPKYTEADFDYIATIDCGWGPFVVGSGVDTASPFVELYTGVELLPVEWKLQIGEDTYHELIPNRYKGVRLTCSYDDGVATGKVKVVVKLDQFLDRLRGGRGRGRGH